MDLLDFIAAATGGTDPLQHWSLLVSIVGGALLVVSLIWKGIPAVWGRVSWMRTKHLNQITNSVVAALEPKFNANSQLLADHMKKEEKDLEERARLAERHNRNVDSRLAALDRGIAGIAGKLGVDLRGFDPPKRGSNDV